MQGNYYAYTPVTPPKQKGVKEFLNEIRHSHLRKDMLEARVEDQRRMLHAVNFDKAHVKGGALNGTEECLARLMDTHEELKAELDHLLALNRLADRLINRLDDYRLCSVLTLRYLCAYSWEAVARETGYTLRWVHQLHRAALCRLEQAVRDDPGLLRDWEKR